MEQAIVYIGIDVAKAHLDVSGAVQCRRFSNERSGHVALVRWLKTSQAPMQLICEASGGYEQALLESLAEEDLAITLVQALRVRQYARAAGILAKTDRIDARVSAAFGAALRPKPAPPLSRQQKRLRELESQRRHLSQVLRAEENRLAQLRCAELRSLGRSLINKIQKQIRAIEECISSLIAQEQTLCAKAQKLTAVTGVTELGQLNRRQVAALAGLAPLNHDSGSLRGRRAIFGGRPALRSGIYMAALAAARYNPILSRFYQPLRARGKLHQLALTAVMRKLLLALNHTLKSLRAGWVCCPALLR
jgi:transposase